MAFISIPTSVGGVALPGKLGSIASGPLSALFGNRALPTLNYPTELATDATKSHYVTFKIKEVVPAKYATENIRRSTIKKIRSTTARSRRTTRSRSWQS